MKVRPNTDAFTLVELLVVMAVIVLLAGILMPTVRATYEQKDLTACQANLRQLAYAVHISTAENCLKVPPAAEWVGYAVEYGVSAILKCPKDSRQVGFEGLDNTTSGGLDDVYIVHDHCDGHQYTYGLTDALSGDVNKNAGNQITVTNISNTEKELWMDGMGSIRITLGRSITVTIARMKISNSGGTGSNQYLYQGDKMLLQLRGKDHWGTDAALPAGTLPSVTIPWSAAGVSYGMNKQVRTKPTRLDQLMLVEYTTSMVDLGVNGSYTQDFDVNFAPRHNDKANYATVEGGVSCGTRSELDPDTNPIWKP